MIQKLISWWFVSRNSGSHRLRWFQCVLTLAPSCGRAGCLPSSCHSGYSPTACRQADLFQLGGKVHFGWNCCAAPVRAAQPLPVSPTKSGICIRCRWGCHSCTRCISKTDVDGQPVLGNFHQGSLQLHETGAALSLILPHPSPPMPTVSLTSGERQMTTEAGALGPPPDSH